MPSPTFLVDYHNVHSVLARRHPVASRRAAFTQDVVDWVVDRLAEGIHAWRRSNVPDWVDCDVRLYSGWFLDEWFTRIALRTWRSSQFRRDTDFAPDLVDTPPART